MKSFFVHDNTGKILRTGFCADSDITLQALAGETVVEGAANDATQIYVNGAFQQKPDESDDVKTASALAEIRVLRSDLLSDSDWTQMPDSPLTAEQRTQWQMYRQELRDLPADFAHVTSIDDVVFPNAPSG